MSSNISFCDPIVFPPNSPGRIQMRALGDYAERFFHRRYAVYHIVNSVPGKTEISKEPIVYISPWKEIAGRIALTIITGFLFPVVMLVIKGIYRWKNNFRKLTPGAGAPALNLPPLPPFQLPPAAIPTPSADLLKSLSATEKRDLLALQKKYNSFNGLSSAKWKPKTDSNYPDYLVSDCYYYLTDQSFSDRSIDLVFNLIIKEDPYNLARLMIHADRDHKEILYKKLKGVSEWYYNQTVAQVFILGSASLPEDFYEGDSENKLKSLLAHILPYFKYNLENFQKAKYYEWRVREIVYGLTTYMWRLSFAHPSERASIKTYGNKEHQKILSDFIITIFKEISAKDRKLYASLFADIYTEYSKKLNPYIKDAMDDTGFKSSQRSIEFYDLCDKINSLVIKLVSESHDPAHSSYYIDIYRDMMASNKRGILNVIALADHSMLAVKESFDYLSENFLSVPLWIWLFEKNIIDRNDAAALCRHLKIDLSNAEHRQKTVVQALYLNGDDAVRQKYFSGWTYSQATGWTKST